MSSPDVAEVARSVAARQPLDALWQRLSAATVYEAAYKLGDMSPHIRQMVAGTHCAGRALTVKCLVGDWSAAARAVDMAGEGDVLVIDVGGTDRSIGWGGTASAFCQRRGVAGVVTNGAIRDLDEIRELRFPVFASGSCVRSGQRSHPGWIGLPVSVGDVVVSFGDVVVGDADGVVVVSQKIEQSVLERAGKMVDRNERLNRDLATATSYAALTSMPVPAAGNEP
jgi:4-hydroxy-4-methyl-2-oxoglutarate aldolase